MNTIKNGDCVREMKRLPAESIDLAFADPPFNIGYAYDVYSDSLPLERYLEWSRSWMAEVHRVLKGNGTFWLAIGDEYAAELKVEAQKIGFHCRSWVIWYYTFGVNCSRKFTRSHAHLFHFVKDHEEFVFRADAPENRVPSARQLVYNDNRANPRGRLPDDTWIIRPANAVGELSDDEVPSLLDLAPHDEDRTWTLRPQDLAGRFQPHEDTWYFPRVAGTFKERAGFHGCQMPEQLLGRIIRTCSAPGAVVLDPFSGSGTTVAVAKKLGRKYLAFDLSEDYVRQGLARLEAIRVGDPLDGSPEPLASAPRTKRKTPNTKHQTQNTKHQTPNTKHQTQNTKHKTPNTVSARQLELTLDGIMEAFAATHDGFSADRVVADPQLNSRFTDVCRAKGLAGEPRSWNMLLLRLRKAGKLVDIETRERTTLNWEECDPFLFASEIAWRQLLDDELAGSLDEILCDPILASRFDQIAASFAPGFTPLQYRLAALKLRKQSKLARVRAASLVPPTKLGKPTSVTNFDPQTAPAGSGVYLLGDASLRKRKHLYAGEAVNLNGRLTKQFERDGRAVWMRYADVHGIAPKDLQIWVRPLTAANCEMLAWQTCLVRRYQPALNLAISE